MVADLHHAASSFRPAPGAVWKRWYGRDLGDSTRGYGHGDLGPWNVMAADGLPVGIIDWDSAGPIDPVVDLAQAAWLNVQLHDDDIAERVGLGDATQRSRQLRLFLDGYRLPNGLRTGFVDRLIEVAITDAASEAVEHRISPETSTGVAPDGYPVAWGMAWRARSAAWMIRHRSLLERAIAPTG